MSAIVARKSFQPANEDVNRREKGPAIGLIGWSILINFLENWKEIVEKNIWKISWMRNRRHP